MGWNQKLDMFFWGAAGGIFRVSPKTVRAAEFIALTTNFSYIAAGKPKSGTEMIIKSIQSEPKKHAVTLW